MNSEQLKALHELMAPMGTPATRPPDARYTVTLECVGMELPQYVARFCGGFIGWCDTRQSAVELCYMAHGIRLGVRQ